MAFDTSLADASYALAERWEHSRDSIATASFTKADIKGFSANQFGLFLETLAGYRPFERQVLERLESEYGAAGSGNSEIRVRSFCRGVAGADDGFGVVAVVQTCAQGGVLGRGGGKVGSDRWEVSLFPSFAVGIELMDVRRMKYCRPIYLAVHRVDPALARKTFLESGVHFLHPIAKRLIAKVRVSFGAR